MGKYDAIDVNVYQSNIFHTKMLIKEIELQHYLFNTDVYKLTPKQRLEITMYINSDVALTAQKAFYSEKKQIPPIDSASSISGEFVMAYPPGIPILAPGERITEEMINYILYAKDKGCVMTGLKTRL